MTRRTIGVVRRLGQTLIPMLLLAPGACEPGGASGDDRDQSCDDGTQPTCEMVPPDCAEWEILAYQGDCYVCVDPATCEPWGSQGCTGDGDCASGVCTAGVCMLCRAGTHRCFGNWLRICAADESSWEDVEHCDALAGIVCSASNGACEPVQPIGNGPNDPTGEYYQFAYFTLANSAFQGGYSEGRTVDQTQISFETLQ